MDAAKTSSQVDELNMQEEYIAEIINKRSKNGDVEYLVKWSGKEETWELADNLKLTNLIEAFELELKRRQEEESHFARGLEPDTIIGCTDKLGYLQFLVKWKGVDQANLISAKEVKERYPKIVVEFFRERLSWRPRDSQK